MSVLAAIVLATAAMALAAGASAGLGAQFAGAAAASPAAAMSWSASENPVRNDAAPDDLGPVSCAGPTLCVAGSSDGVEADLLVSAEPAAGASAWTIVTLPGDELISSVSCPGVALCVVGDGSGDVWVSTDPTGGFRAWHRTKLENPINTTGLNGMSCPTTTLCVASDVNGNVWSSADPAGGRRAWHHWSAPIGSDHVNGPVSCASASLCVLLDDKGRAYATETPLHGGWHATGSPTDRAIEDAQLSCLASVCLAAATGASGQDTVYVSSDPAGPVPWTATVLPAVVNQALAANPEIVSCGAPGLCVVADASGHILSSGDPIAGSATWNVVDLGSQALAGVACTPDAGSAPGACVAVGSAGHAFAAPGPTGPWAGGVVNGWSPLTGVSCLTRSSCVAVDSAGNVLRAAIQPPSGAGGPAATWSVSTPAPGRPFGGLACPNLRLCIAGGAQSTVWVSRPSIPGTARWRRQSLPLRGHANVNAIACPSDRLCAVVDGRGEVAVSTHPTGGRQSWQIERRLPAQGTQGGAVPESLTFVTCPSIHLCLAGDQSTPYLEGDRPGMLLSSRDPSQRGSWHGQRLGFGDVACPSARLCLATGDSGRLAYSHDPAGGRRAWHFVKLRSHLRDLGPLTPIAISCADATICAIGGTDARGAGIVATSSDPTNGNSWRVTELTGSPIVGVSCRRRPLCIATSQAGEVFIGLRSS
jgi:hypothetical protein